MSKELLIFARKIIPVVDVRLKFSKAAIPYNERTCIIVVDIRDMSIGLIVDHVAEVLNLTVDNIVDPPEATTTDNSFIKGIGKTRENVILILNCEQLVEK